MALQFTCSFKGFAVPEAYAEVVHVGLHKLLPGTQIGWRLWKDATKQEMLEQYNITVDYSSAMAMSQAYILLKTLPEFAGAVDV